MNILFSSVGRRATLLKNFKSAHPDVKILAVDNSIYAPALNFADQKFIAPRIDDPDYINFLVEICVKHKVKALTTLIDPEIELLSKNRDLFLSKGILPLCPNLETARICFDKFLMFQYLSDKGIDTVLTFNDIQSFQKSLEKGEVSFPVFIKPRTGSASVGAEKIDNLIDLENRLLNNLGYNYIIQELMTGDDIDADVYVDCISNNVVSIFLKRKIETRVGGASKTISFKDQKLFDLIRNILSNFNFFGPLDMDFFYRNGKYYLSEINPRFGGAYLHAFGAGVDFYKLIINNINGKINLECVGKYEDDILMMMYDDVVIKKLSDI